MSYSVSPLQRVRQYIFYVVWGLPFFDGCVLDAGPKCRSRASRIEVTWAGFFCGDFAVDK